MTKYIARRGGRRRKVHESENCLAFSKSGTPREAVEAEIATLEECDWCTGAGS